MQTTSPGEVAWASDKLREMSFFYYPGCVMDEHGDIYIFDFSGTLTKYSHSGKKLQIFKIGYGMIKIIVTTTGDIVIKDIWKSCNNTDIIIYAKDGRQIQCLHLHQELADYDVNLTSGQLFTTNQNGIEIYN